MTAKLLTEHHLEFLSWTVGCTGSSESTHVKMPHFKKSYIMAHLVSGFSVRLVSLFHRAMGFCGFKVYKLKNFLALIISQLSL